MGCGLGFHFKKKKKFEFKIFGRFFVMVGGRMVLAVVRLDSQADGLLWFDGKHDKDFFFLADGGRVAEHGNLGFDRWFYDGWKRKIRDFFFGLKLDLFCSDSKIDA